MKLSTIFAFIASSLALAVVAALMSSSEGRLESGTSFFNVAYDFSEDEGQIGGDTYFSLPEFVIPIREIVDSGPTVETITDTGSTIVKIQRPSTPRTGQLTITQNNPTGFEQKFGGGNIPNDPIAEFLKKTASSQSSLALEVDKNDGLKMIQAIDAAELINPSPSITQLLDNSARLLRISQIPFSEKPVGLQIYDLAQPGTDQYLKIRESLVKKCNAGICNAEELKAAGFLLINEGEYAAGRAMYEQINSASLLGSNLLGLEENDGHITFEISGKVLDRRGRGIDGATVKALDGSAETVTDRYGNYSFEIDGIFDLYKVRLNASKPGYSTATVALDLITSDGLTDREISGMNFTLENPIRSVTINNKTGKVSGKDVSVKEDKFIIETDWSRYEIPFDALVRADGSNFTGELKVYLFEFDKNSDIGQLLMNDVFDEVAGYAGNIMKTFGMPFILFVDKNGNSIHVLKSNPMILQNKIIEMQALRTNQDQIYEPVTDADLIFLKAKSEELGGYPITRDFLIDEDIVRFPCFWIYDQLKGIWENIGVKLISTDGEIETIFYTLNDVD